MRILLLVATGVAMLAAACAPEKKPAPRAAVTVTTPEAPQLIALFPRDLLLAEKEMIPGQWKAVDGSLAYPQWNRRWDRDPADPGARTGATSITDTARLYLTLDDSMQDFQDTATGDNGAETVRQAIQVRGFDPKLIKVTPVDPGQLGADRQSAWRVEFSRGSTVETYVQYFAFIHVKNTRALVTAFAQFIDGTEPPKVLDELKQVAKKQTDHLSALPTSAQPPPASITATPAPTP